MKDFVRYFQAHEPLVTAQGKVRVTQVNMLCKSMTNQGIQVFVYFEVVNGKDIMSRCHRLMGVLNAP